MKPNYLTTASDQSTWVTSRKRDLPDVILPLLDGHKYIVPPGATGEWADKEGQLATRSSGAWSYYVPSAFDAVHILDENFTMQIDLDRDGETDADTLIGFYMCELVEDVPTWFRIQEVQIVEGYMEAVDRTKTPNFRTKGILSRMHIKNTFDAPVLESIQANDIFLQTTKPGRLMEENDDGEMEETRGGLLRIKGALGTFHIKNTFVGTVRECNLAADGQRILFLQTLKGPTGGYFRTKGILAGMHIKNVFLVQDFVPDYLKTEPTQWETF